ncbi:ATP-binding cassette domain-containing protein [Nocardioides jishulii]|uniref:ABC-F family ATP-binding cassette domain-containing protein n=1 Tax=Nocardioides jishulii TaxID=2575440 RepID=A0A4U2YS31_9ACTN|nr:ATP-binding cassette domain-containing protein [Nocardioides jishulii]QCX28874.1 ABC-F family ATP-binding cassette domain-containing protein [Nocardioides jishulii]TKI64229.1 ABC-F family ATP-binding cassette domain-containing protein [Nocardioides jishulii]
MRPAPTHPVPARDRAQLVAAGVTLTRGHALVLDHLDLTVTPGARLAVVGENGRGKTSLLHVLAGRLVPDSGEVRRHGTLAVAEQEMEPSDATVRDAVAAAIAPALDALARLDAAADGLAEGTGGAEEAYAAALADAEALDAWDAERRVDLALEALGAVTDRTRRLDSLSVGQRYRVRLACLLGADDDFLLLDEPTNHLDRSGLEFLTARLHDRSGAVVLVSHDRALLADVADTVLDLDPTADRRPRLDGGGWEAHREARRVARERWEQEYAAQQETYSRLAADLARAQDRLVSGWRPPKGSDKHGRATRAGGLVRSVHRRCDELDALALDVPEPPQRLAFPALPRSRGVLLHVEEVRFAGRLEEAATLDVEGGGRLLLTGPNGAGKSTLLALMARTLAPTSGRVRDAGGLRIGFLRQESDLPLDTVVRDLWLDAGARIPLERLGLLRREHLDKRVGELSVGQQRRLDLALVLARQPHLLLLDEPTNHLSFTLVDELTQGLEQTPAAVVVSTHDRQLLRDMAHWPRMELRAGSGMTGVTVRLPPHGTRRNVRPQQAAVGP